jgi:AcrR family transcriptional regulator
MEGARKLSMQGSRIKKKHGSSVGRLPSDVAARKISTNTRDLILSATARTIREVGLARATTKLIAQTAGISEGAIFKHFKQKNDLLLAVFRGREDMLVLAPGRETAGTDSVQNNLRRIGHAATICYREIVPWLVASLADAALVAEYRFWIVDYWSGNRDINDRTAGYISEEQRLGRIRAEYDPSIIAEMLLGPCFRRVFRHFFLDQRTSCSDEQFVGDLVRVLAQVFVARKSLKRAASR